MTIFTATALLHAADSHIARESIEWCNIWIAVNDLYGLVQDHAEFWSNDGVHFNSKGIAVQAKQVTKRIMESINQGHKRE